MVKVQEHTGIFVTPEEMNFVTQLFGIAHSDPSRDNKDALNNYMKMLAMKYDYEDYWLFSEINPMTREVLLNKEEGCCDEKVSEDNVEVEE